MSVEIPRCRHGAIILGCAEDECLEQNAYLDRQAAAIRRYYNDQQATARRIVRQALGLPSGPIGKETE